MRVTVRLIGSFIEKAGFSEKEFEVPAATTIAGLVGLLGIDLARPMIITRNGHAVEGGDAVSAGDRIAISPVYSGG